MAHPRRTIPGETYLITRRCYQRTFRLRPSVQTKEIFMYCLAFAMQKTGVRLHAACVLSDHHHLVVTDPRGLLPDFLRELHRLVAKAMNASQGQWENLWAAAPCNVVRLVTDVDVADKIAYVVANPVAAGLVKAPEAWPGFVAWGEASFRVSRPTVYFSKKGCCPLELSFAVEAPPMRNTDGNAARAWHDRVTRQIGAKVLAAHRAARMAGRAFLGPEVAVNASFLGQARSHEDKRGRIPTFAARLKAVRDRLRLIEQDFRASYRAALEVWRSGVRDVLFPHGTWGMAVFHAVRVNRPLTA